MILVLWVFTSHSFICFSVNIKNIYKYKLKSWLCTKRQTDTDRRTHRSHLVTKFRSSSAVTWQWERDRWQGGNQDERQANTCHCIQVATITQCTEHKQAAEHRQKTHKVMERQTDADAVRQMRKYETADRGTASERGKREAAFFPAGAEKA